MAPDNRATSTASRNRISVGMHLICHRSPICGTASVFNFASRIRGSSCCAACSKIGAKLLHGPHHGAQQSTSTGTELPLSTTDTLSEFSSIGCPCKICSLHLPHLGLSPRRSVGTRLAVLQLAQVRVVVVIFSPNYSTASFYRNF